MEAEMRSIDRVILIVLALGIWALVLKPTALVAHHSNGFHGCTGSGEVDSGYVSVDGDTGYLIDTSVSITVNSMHF